MSTPAALIPPAPKPPPVPGEGREIQGALGASCIPVIMKEASVAKPRRLKRRR